MYFMCWLTELDTLKSINNGQPIYLLARFEQFLSIFWLQIMFFFYNMVLNIQYLVFFGVFLFFRV